MKTRYIFSCVAASLALATLSAASCSPAPYDSTLASYVAKENFNLQIYELAFCVEEVVAIIENDSLARKTFEERINRAFDSRYNNAQIYIHKLELNFFSQQSKKIISLNSYPNSSLLFDKMVENNKSNNYEKFASQFPEYIESPEQVDDACLIALISDLPNTAWRGIESDKLAMYSFNNWINFGFEEFRFYPGTKSKPKEILNKRIVDYVLQKHAKSSEPLVIRAVRMIDTVKAKY
jgi:hypothetical protein